MGGGGVIGLLPPPVPTAAPPQPALLIRSPTTWCRRCSTRRWGGGRGCVWGWGSHGGGGAWGCPWGPRGVHINICTGICGAGVPQGVDGGPVGGGPWVWGAIDGYLCLYGAGGVSRVLMGLGGPEDPWEWGVSVGLGVLMGVCGAGVPGGVDGGPWGGCTQHCGCLSVGLGVAMGLGGCRCALIFGVGGVLGLLIGLGVALGPPWGRGVSVGLGSLGVLMGVLGAGEGWGHPGCLSVGLRVSGGPMGLGWRPGDPVGLWVSVGLGVLMVSVGLGSPGGGGKLPTGLGVSGGIQERPSVGLGGLRDAWGC